MYSWEYNLFIGDDTVDVHVGFSAGDTLFLVGESSAHDNGDSLKDVLDTIKTAITRQRPSRLQAIESILEAELAVLEPTLVSFAAVYSVQSVLYVFTRGNGEIYIGRDGKMQKLISCDTSASGYLQEHDTLLLTNTTFSTHLESDVLKELLVETSPKEAIETITPQLKGADNAGMIALFMQSHVQTRSETADTETVEDEYIEDQGTVEDESQNDMYVPPTDVKPMQSSHTGLYTQPQPSAEAVESKTQSPRFAWMHTTFARLQSGGSRSKKITFGVVVLLLCVLTWSVVSGNSRRQKAQFLKTVEAQETLINEKLTEAEDLIGVDTPQSLKLIEESRSILTELQQEARQKKLESIPQLSEIAQHISSTEQSIKKLEKGEYSEYYDLNLIEKGASAQSMFTDGEWIVLMDRKKKQVYMLDIKEKAVEIYSVKDIGQASYVSVHQDIPYVWGKTIGVVKLVETQKGEVVIEKDSAWKNVRDFWMYSGNVYLADAGSSDIHKYLVATEGYSSKRSYVSAPSSQLSKTTAIAIDSDMYVAAGSSVLKYASGVREDFPLSIPDDSGVTFEDIFTSQDVDSVYLLDTDSQRIFIVSKEGVFEKQVSADILKRADDFIVDPEHGILVLAQDTIYQLEE